jgi:hypothetical protein
LIRLSGSKEEEGPDWRMPEVVLVVGEEGWEKVNALGKNWMVTR